MISAINTIMLHKSQFKKMSSGKYCFCYLWWTQKKINQRLYMQVIQWKMQQLLNYLNLGYFPFHWDASQSNDWQVCIAIVLSFIHTVLNYRTFLWVGVSLLRISAVGKPSLDACLKEHWNFNNFHMWWIQLENIK